MFETHGEQCCYIDEKTGERCPSRSFIQRDHWRMRAHGGTHDAKNLRPLCGAHNRLLARLALGNDYIQRCIDLRQQKHGNTNDPEDS